ncbi:MAG: exo-alpha-sialidase [Desulfobacterales bacterium]|nr:exo-alpha-sialidase [Desulfobacterales bacterium]
MKTILKAILLVFFAMASQEVWADRNFAPVAIHLASNTGDPDVYYVHDRRRIVRVHDTILALAPTGARDQIYRSTDNGANWTQLGNNPLNTYSSFLLSVGNETVFHFFRNGDKVYMVKFRYDAPPPPPMVIYTDANLAYTSHGVYGRVAGTVDRDGVLFVAVHGNATGVDASNPDSIYLIESEDNGATWTRSGEARVIRQGNADRSWGFMHLDVSGDNELLCVYAAWNGEALEVASSSDRGRSWKTTQLASGGIYKPAVLPVNDREIYVFAQSRASDHASNPIKGLVFNKSEDSGATWSGWQTIDGSAPAGDDDPSPGLGSDGAIYVAYGSWARSDSIDTQNGEALRQRLAVSDDGGKTWRVPAVSSTPAPSAPKNLRIVPGP